MTKIVFQTERLIVRQFQASDLEALLAYRNDPEVWRYQGWGAGFSSQQTQQFIADMSTRTPGELGWTQLAIETRASATMIGDVALNALEFEAKTAMIGYTLARGAWGHGYALEAVTGTLKHAFENLAVHRIRANCDARNDASWRLLEKLGREAHFVESYLENGEWFDEYEYALLEREWFGLKS
jgi:RimJ/RimL family protein N-acetyltransferase